MTDHNTHDPMQQLRQLLFKEQEARIATIEKVRDNKELHSKEIAEVLVEALELRAHDESLGKALSPAVESAVSNSIAKDPKALADALFPVMGPAIRRSIQYAISEMLQSLSQTLEHAFSLKSLAWRWEAFRTEKSFAEIVMLNTLLYRVEQVFWIHKETGLLLAHESFDPKLTEDADVVSSMLTAVGDFIQDSFAGDEEQEVQSLRLGDLEVLIEQAPDSVLAVVCRGHPPRSLHSTLSETIEKLQQTFSQHLKGFDGDTSLLATADSLIAPLLLVDYIKEDKKSPVKLMVALALLALVLVGWQSWNFKQDIELKHRWQSYIQTLKETPGLVITSVEKHDGLHHIYGLRDPLSIQAESLLESFQLQPADVRYHFQAYHALNHDIMLKRLRHVSKAPHSISFQINDDVLYVHGTASQAWLSKFSSIMPWINGIMAVNIDDVDIPKTLQERIRAALPPNRDIVLHLKGQHLSLTGFASQAWLQRSKAIIASFKEIVFYDDQAVIRLDSDSYLLQQAQQSLKPPASVHLSIIKNHRLKAHGYAKKSWVNKARIKVKSLKNISGFDTKALKALKQVILTRAIKALKPPKNVYLAFKKGKLSATGDAKKHWISFANKQALHIKGVTSFQNNVQRIWNEKEILQQAIQRLHPDSSVQLSVADGVLQARGKATQAWIHFAHQEASHIDGVARFDEQLTVIFDDATILQQALSILQPPEGVHLQVSQGILKVKGEANSLWVNQLNDDISMIQGVQHLDAKDLKSKVKIHPWQTLKVQVAALHLVSKSNQPMLNAKDISKLKELSQLYHRAAVIHPSTVLHISLAHGHAEKLVMMMRSRAIHQQLRQGGVPEFNMKTQIVARKTVMQGSFISFSLALNAIGKKQP